MILRNESTILQLPPVPFDTMEMEEQKVEELAVTTTTSEIIGSTGFEVMANPPSSVSTMVPFEATPIKKKKKKQDRPTASLTEQKKKLAIEDVNLMEEDDEGL